MSGDADRARSKAFESWLETTRPGATARQRPEQELLAEHHLMGSVLGAMEQEARRLRGGDPLRPEFWGRVVDFIGDFTHRVHRVKEEEVFFPALEGWGLVDPEVCRHLHSDHEKLEDLTRVLCEGVGEGDWEKAFRVVAIYLDRIRPHLEAEEQRLLAPDLGRIPEPGAAFLSRRFASIEAEVLGADGRGEVLALVQSLRRDTGLEPIAPG